jgi:hypothetical protein
VREFTTGVYRVCRAGGARQTSDALCVDWLHSHFPRARWRGVRSANDSGALRTGGPVTGEAGAGAAATAATSVAGAAAEAMASAAYA